MTEEYSMALTPEHAAQIKVDGLYKGKPNDFKKFWQSGAQYWDTSGAYHCKNWCFEPHIWRDGRVFMTDNYWGSYSDSMAYEITDENFDEMFPKFELVMENRHEWERTSRDNAKRFDPKDVVYDVAAGSGGYTCSSTTWVRKGAKPAVARDVAHVRGELSSAIRSTLDTYELGLALRKMEELLKTAQDQNIDVTDADEREKVAAMVTLHVSDEVVSLGDVCDGDMAVYLAERCYCPGEIYDNGGFYYKIYKSEDEVRLIGSPKAAGEDRIAECYFSEANEEIVEVLIDTTDNHVVDAVRFDATAHNIEQCACDVAPGDYKLTSFDVTHSNVGVPALVEKAQALMDEMDKIKEMFE